MIFLTCPGNQIKTTEFVSTLFLNKKLFRLVSATLGEILTSSEYVFSWLVYPPLRRGRNRACQLSIVDRCQEVGLKGFWSPQLTLFECVLLIRVLNPPHFQNWMQTPLTGKKEHLTTSIFSLIPTLKITLNTETNKKQMNENMF